MINTTADLQQFNNDPAKIDWVSQRVDEFATELQNRLAQSGIETSFGFASGRSASHFMGANEQIGIAQDALPDHKAIAFGLQASNALLIKRSAEYPFKSLVGSLIAAQVNVLISEDGRRDEFNSLWLNSMHSHTAELRQDALKTLHRKSAPYYARAQEIVAGHVAVYNPHNPSSPRHRESYGA